MCRLTSVLIRLAANVRTQFCSIVAIRLVALAGFVLALTLAPSPFLSGGGVAEGKQKQSCFDKYAGCVGRCNKKAGLDPVSSKNNTKQEIEAAQRCEQRTCMHQLRSCWARESASKSALDTGSPSMSSPIRPGLLETTPGFRSQGPAASGSGAAPAAPPPVKLY
jgi:hypothetical protein